MISLLYCLLHQTLPLVHYWWTCISSYAYIKVIALCKLSDVFYRLVHISLASSVRKQNSTHSKTHTKRKCRSIRIISGRWVAFPFHSNTHLMRLDFVMNYLESYSRLPRGQRVHWKPGWKIWPAANRSCHWPKKWVANSECMDGEGLVCSIHRSGRYKY